MMRKLRTLMVLTMLGGLFPFLSACALAQEDDTGDETSLDSMLEGEFSIGFVLYLDSEDTYDPNAVGDLETLKDATELYFMAHETENDDGFPYTAVEKGRGLESDGTNLISGSMEVGETTVETLEISEDFTFHYGPDLIGEIVTVYSIKEHSETGAVNLELLQRFQIDQFGGMSISVGDTHEIDDRPFYVTDFTIDFMSASILEAVSLFVMDETHALVETIEVDLDVIEAIVIDQGDYAIIEKSFEDGMRRSLIEEDTIHGMKMVNEASYAIMVPLEVTFSD